MAWCHFHPVFLWMELVRKLFLSIIMKLSADEERRLPKLFDSISNDSPRLGIFVPFVCSASFCIQKQFSVNRKQGSDRLVGGKRSRCFSRSANEVKRWIPITGPHFQTEYRQLRVRNWMHRNAFVKQFRVLTFFWERTVAVGTSRLLKPTTAFNWCFF